MLAYSSTFPEMVRANRRLVIPLYQRHYRWGPKQFASLADDILRQYRAVKKHQGLSEEERSRLIGAHYMGAVVLSESQETADEWDVIDGQQRLTTVSLLLAALRDVQLPLARPGRRRGNDDAEQGELRELRKNYNSTYFVTAPTRPGASSTPRLIPQKRDEVPFNQVLNWADPSITLTASGLGLSEPSNVLPAYAYFKRLLKTTAERASSDSALSAHADLFPLDLELVREVVTTRLKFIEVRTTTVDDANAIFESLNYKVVALDAIDLLKNYMFMLLRSEATRLLDDWWNPSVARVGGEEKQLGNFVLNDLVSRGRSTSSRALYETKQAELREIFASGGKEALWGELTRLRVSMDRYLIASDPATHCTNPVLKRALIDIHEARGATAVPLLMYIMEAAQADEVEEAELLRSLRLVESYLIRRFITGLDGHNLNSYFSSMLSRAFGKDADFYQRLTLEERVAAILDSSGKDWPTDATLSEAILLGQFYGRGEPSQRMLTLKRLDQQGGQRLEIVYSESAIELEHILPQGASAELTGYWQRAATDARMSIDELQRRYLDSLANIVPLVSSENRALGNKPFPTKAAVYGESSLKLTASVADAFGQAGLWGEDQLKARAAALASLAVAAWPKPEAARPPAAGTGDEGSIDEDEDPVLEAEQALVDDTLD